MAEKKPVKQPTIQEVVVKRLAALRKKDPEKYDDTKPKIKK